MRPITIVITANEDDFNPRTREGMRRTARAGSISQWQILIHAPVKGCDAKVPYEMYRDPKILIHAPVKGCDSEIV